MPKNDSLIIRAPRQGIAQSPHVGFADVRNLDIYSVPGVARLNLVPSKESGSTVTAQVYWFARDPVTVAKLYALDSNGVVYNSTDTGDTWASLSDRAGSGHGMVIWKDYLFVATTTGIDTYGPLSGAPAWTTDWKTIDTDSLWHPMIVSSNDGNLYGGAGQFIFSVAENSGQTFAPGTSATYTFTQQALDLPDNYRVKCLAELGNNLMIGTWQGTNVFDIRVANIFPWDRSSASFGQPVIIDDFGVHAMLVTGGSLVVLAGIDGSVYLSNGVTATPVARIPVDISRAKYIEYYPGAIMKFQNRIFFGVGNGGSTVVAGMGVYSLTMTSTVSILALEQTSTGYLSDSFVNKISAVLPITRERYLTGWRANTTYGLDLTSSGSYSYGTAYTGYFESPLYTVGTNRIKRRFEKMIINLAKDLGSNLSVQVSYRTNLTDSYTTIGTYTSTTEGSVEIIEKTPNIPACVMLQIKVGLQGSSTATPEFIQLELI